MKQWSVGGGIAAAAVLLLLASVSITFAALTFSGTSITGDSNSVIDATGTISIGASSATGITIGQSGETVLFPGTVSSTNLFTGNATTTNLAITGLGASGSPCLTVNAAGNVATTTCGGGGSGTNYWSATSTGIYYNGTGTVAASTAMSTPQVTINGAPLFATDGDTVGARNAAIAAGPGASITVLDNFQRPNTAPGVMGNLLTGQAWDVRTEGFLVPPSTYPNVAQVLNDSYTTPDAWSYIVATSPVPVTRIGLQCTWQPRGGTNPGGECVMAIMPNVPSTVAAITIAAHIEVTIGGMTLSYFPGNGTSDTIGHMTWPNLSYGVSYAAEALIHGDTLTFTLYEPNAQGNMIATYTGTFSDPHIASLGGPYVFFEETNQSTNIVSSAMQQVWAGTAGTSYGNATQVNGAAVLGSTPILATNSSGQIVSAQSQGAENWLLWSNRPNQSPYITAVSPPASLPAFSSSTSLGPKGETGDVWNMISTLNGSTTAATLWYQPLTGLVPNHPGVFSIWMMSLSGTCLVHIRDYTSGAASQQVSVSTSWSNFSVAISTSANGTVNPGIQQLGGLDSNSCNLLIAQPQLALNGGAFLATTGSPVDITGLLPINGGFSMNGSTVLSLDSTGTNLVTSAGGSISETAAGLSGPSALPSGTTAITQSVGDSTTKIATDAFVLANAAGLNSSSVIPNGVTATTQSASDNSQKLATTAQVQAAIASVASGYTNIYASVTGQPQGTTVYTVPTLYSSSEALVQAYVLVGKTIQGLFCQTGGVPAGQSATYTVRSGSRGGLSNSSLTCTIPGSSFTCSNTTNTLALTPGQYWDVAVTLSATSTT
jgi:hypothetical protein